MNYNFFHKLNYLSTKEDKKLLLILVIMSFFLSIIETVGISAIMPFISTASNPKLIYTNEYYKMVYDFFNLASSKEFVILFGTSLIFFYIFRGAYTVYHGYLVAKFSMNKYRDFVDKLFENYINMPYIEYVKRNSTTMSKTIHTEAYLLSLIIDSILKFFVEAMVIITLYILLLLINIKMTIVLTVILGIKIILIIFTVSKKIEEKGSQREDVQKDFYKLINDTLSNLKIIKFISNQNKLLDEYRKITSRFTKIYIIGDTLKIVPKTILEAVGLSILMLMVIYVVVYKNNVNDVIPIISMYALALYRILPAVSKIIFNYNNIIFYSSSLDAVYNDISYSYSKEEYSDTDITFVKSIYLDNISFSYDKDETLIENLSLKIQKGKKIAFTGESGSGKSTLVDIICGIYRPDSGKIFIDGVELDNSNIVSWRRKIGYIPQDIYLFDGTIAENITFGREYNEQKLIMVLKQANIYELIMQKDGFDTMVGEDGIQLSGGQKQRIGIARALYGDPEILVLDEATSALDIETESVIMDELYKASQNKTLIIIAHRLNTIERCDIKIDISNTKLYKDK